MLGITQVTIVSLSTDNPVVGIVGEINRADCHHSFILIIHTVGITGITVANAMSVVGAQTDTESGNGVVIHTEGDTVFVGDIKLQRRLMSLMDPTCIGEVVSIQTGKELCLITEVFIASPERDTCLVPGGGENGVLTLGAVYRKEI